MGKRVITVELDPDMLEETIRELEGYEREVLVKEQTLLAKLSAIGLQEAKVRFTNAVYDGVNDVDVEEVKIYEGYKIVANGEAVAFIEFGSGVTYNGSSSYAPLEKPVGIVGIGEYGQGKGKRRAWYYKGEPGTNGEINEKGYVKTRGNPAAMSMWHSSEEMRKALLQVAKEVFG